MIQYNLFPDGKHLCLTMSFDDGRVYDRQLVSIFNQYGIKGTFHLNSGKLDQDDYITSKEVKDLYQGHEVACHSVNHYHLEELSDITIIREILEDKKHLEELTGYVVRGLSYPFGTYNQRVLDILKNCGIEYSRTVASTNKFLIAQNYLEWHPTLHIKTNIDDKWDAFLRNPFNELRIFYIWGHSYEFNDHQNWGLIADFCKLASHHPDVYYATNIEIKDYLEALKQLRISVDETIITNPTNLDLWITKDGRKVCIPSNTTWKAQ